MPLLRASLENMPNGVEFYCRAERQSLASKFQRNKIGKKPDIMALMKYKEKINELIYVESSRIICDDTKKTEDEVKLWRETLDGMDYVNVACRPVRNQFGIIGIQIAGEDIYLNVLVNDAGGLSRYFHLCHAEIPLTPQTPWRIEPLVHLLLTLR
ncbi:34064_t:CDS:2, partial [Racocetra persica]